MLLGKSWRTSLCKGWRETSKIPVDNGDAADAITVIPSVVETRTATTPSPIIDDTHPVVTTMSAINNHPVRPIRFSAATRLLSAIAMFATAATAVRSLAFATATARLLTAAATATARLMTAAATATARLMTAATPVALAATASSTLVGGVAATPTTAAFPLTLALGQCRLSDQQHRCAGEKHQLAHLESSVMGSLSLTMINKQSFRIAGCHVNRVGPNRYP